jgi:hypothetical protein
MDKSLKKLLQNLVSIENATGSKNSSGEDTFSTPIVYKGRVEYKVTLVRDKLGDEVYSKSKTFFDSDVLVQTGDLVTLPTGETFPVISVSIKYDEKGAIDHKVVYA